MIKQTIKAVVLLTASAVAIPYTLAILANMMYGWPQRKDKYRRALHPRKVYALNYALLQHLARVRYLGLMIQWKYFYNSAKEDRVVKDLPYGSKDNSLDIYFPHDAHGKAIPGKKPVAIFIYGGTWASGDKNMYGLLCAQLADKLKAVVCCPNYSTYPKGYVDDMVQDMVDCLTWIQQHGEDFNGDKNQIIMIGHSAGGHLCVMSILELTMKQLLHHPEAVLVSLTGPSGLTVSRQSSIFSDSMRFEDKHFNGSNTSSVSGDGEINGSFYVVDEKESTERSFIVLDEDNGAEANKQEQEVAEEQTAEPKEDQDEGQEEVKHSEQTKEVTFEMNEAGDAEEVLKVEVTEECTDELPTETLAEEIDDLSQSQREAKDILSSVKLVIGLSGVYHIAEHYEHEAWRGVEDISSMAKAMYGQEHFDRLSPSLLVSELPDKIKLPPILLVHGDKDKTVPLSSSLRFGQSLWDKGCYDVSVSVIPGCGHLDLCLDLMDVKRQWYASVMNEILKGAQKCL